MTRSHLVLLAAVTVATAACSNQRQAPYDRCLDSRDVSLCHSVVSAGGDADDFINYGMQGYLLGMMNGQQYVYHDDHYRGPSHYYPQNVVRERVIIDRRPATINNYRQQQATLQQAKAAGTVKPYVPGAYTVKSTTATLNPSRTSQTLPDRGTMPSSSVKSPVYSYKPAQAPTTSYKSTTTTTTTYKAPTPSYSAPKSYSAPSYSSPSRSYSAPTTSYSSSSKK